MARPRRAHQAAPTATPEPPSASLTTEAGQPSTAEATCPQPAALRTGENRPRRDAGGRFVKGASGNAGGRPREVGHVRELAQRRTEQSIRALERIVEVGDRVAGQLLEEAKTNGGKIDGDSDQASLMRAGAAAAEALLDRGWGRPTQEVAFTPNRPFVVQHRIFAPGVDPLAAKGNGSELTVARPALPPPGGA
jgi:hypothetical protein